MSDELKKYRPVFSELEVKSLAFLLKRAYLDDLGKSGEDELDADMLDMLIKLMGKMTTLESKIANSLAVASYTINPPKAITILESLGASEETIAKANGLQTKEEYWAICYDQYIKDPMHSPVQIVKAAMEHMYLHDLMTPEQVTKFEATMLGEL